jgi:hypothetical protein
MESTMRRPYQLRVLLYLAMASTFDVLVLVLVLGGWWAVRAVARREMGRRGGADFVVACYMLLILAHVNANAQFRFAVRS